MPDQNAEDWLDLLATPLDVGAATKFVAASAAGGIDIFLGTTRVETSTTGEELLALDYHAYESMARRQLVELSRGARKQWPVVRLAILHRLGSVAVGEASVLIAVSTPHRAEAFAACRWIIDELKKQVTIWKQEVWADGAKTWVHPPS
jgi:molybdopterin synthase catalytic subunit